MHVWALGLSCEAPATATGLEERHGKRTSGGASKERTPQEEPRMFGSGPHDLRLTAHLGLGQLALEPRPC